jgi:LPS O-antigen subunit length determinant protein (WzzB/FepE family)
MESNLANATNETSLLWNEKTVIIFIVFLFLVLAGFLLKAIFDSNPSKNEKE